MEDGLFSWSDFMVQLPWFDSLKEQFTKPLGLSLGVKRMWTNLGEFTPSYILHTRAFGTYCYLPFKKDYKVMVFLF